MPTRITRAGIRAPPAPSAFLLNRSEQRLDRCRFDLVDARLLERLGKALDVQRPDRSRQAAQIVREAHRVAQRALGVRDAEPRAEFALCLAVAQQQQPRAAATRGRTVGLLERLEQPRLHVRRDADAGVPHRKAQPRAFEAAARVALARVALACDRRIEVQPRRCGRGRGAGRRGSRRRRPPRRRPRRAATHRRPIRSAVSTPDPGPDDDAPARRSAPARPPSGPACPARALRPPAARRTARCSPLPVRR